MQGGIGAEQVLLFGGVDRSSDYIDSKNLPSMDPSTYIFHSTVDLNSSRWEEIEYLTENTPPSRQGHAMAALGEDVLLFGGYASIILLGLHFENHFYNDTVRHCLRPPDPP